MLFNISTSKCPHYLVMTGQTVLAIMTLLGVPPAQVHLRGERVSRSQMAWVLHPHTCHSDFSEHFTPTISPFAHKSQREAENAI